MAVYKVGDIVIHWTYGSGKIVAIKDQGLLGYPCLYYVIEGDRQTLLWVPVDEKGSSSLHLPTSRSDFKLLIDILRTQGERMSNNPYKRYDQLEERMQKASPEDLCLIIRDLNYRSHSQKLNSHDIRVMRHAQSFLTEDWERSLGTPREMAQREMEWILKEAPVRQHTF
jgi:RNA polymerase-interacting CarD/CdnL/TRCF family regulator